MCCAGRGASEELLRKHVQMPTEAYIGNVDCLCRLQRVQSVTAQARGPRASACTPRCQQMCTNSSPAAHAGRDAFKELLRKHAELGIVQARTTWTRYRESVRKEPELLSLAANTSGSRPKELFLDALADIEEAFSKDKARLKRIVADAEFAITGDTEWEDFLNVLHGKDAECAPVDSLTWLCFERFSVACGLPCSGSWTFSHQMHRAPQRCFLSGVRDGADDAGVTCSDISDANKRLFFQEAYERAQVRHLATMECARVTTLSRRCPGLSRLV
jgi:FF domain